MIRDPYEILGVDKNASKDEIKRAYRKKTKEKSCIFFRAKQCKNMIVYTGKQSLYYSITT